MYLVQTPASPDSRVFLQGGYDRVRARCDRVRTGKFKSKSKDQSFGRSRYVAILMIRSRGEYERRSRHCNKNLHRSKTRGRPVLTFLAHGVEHARIHLQSVVDHFRRTPAASQN
jgi:hypothetical protein